LLYPLRCSLVSRVSYSNAVALRETQATPILRQVRSDVTRFRYGDEQHLDEALQRIFRINKAGGIRRNQAPVLARLREEVQDGKYTLVLGFDSVLPYSEWEVSVRTSRFAVRHASLVPQSRQSKFTSFFGPGVSAVLTQTEKGVDVALLSDGSAGGQAEEQDDVLPPLMPGLPARRLNK